MPSTLTVRTWPASSDGVIAFEVLNADGDPAVEDGLLVLGPDGGR